MRAKRYARSISQIAASISNYFLKLRDDLLSNLDFYFFRTNVNNRNILRIFETICHCS